MSDIITLRKYISVFLIIAMVFSSAFVHAYANGDGEIKVPYLISKVEEILRSLK